MLNSIELKLDEISTIYTSIFQWIITRDSSFIFRVEQARLDFLYDKYDSLQLNEQYNSSYKIAQQILAKIKQYYDLININQMVSYDIVDLSIFVSLLKKLYLDVQKEIFLYNTIYNKIFFEEKLELIYSQVSQYLEINILDLLSYIDQSTEYSYLENKKLPLTDFGLGSYKVVEEFIKILSIQKYWERIYNNFFHDQFSPLLIDLRSKIHKCFEKNNITVTHENKFCVWNLLDYIDQLKIV